MMRVLLLALLACLLLGGRAEAGCPPLPYVFVPGTTADANQVNANFNAVTTCAGTGSITVANTTALRAACTSTTGCPAGHPVFLNGAIRLTDGIAGAPPLYFSVGSGVCSTDDGASCVNSSNGASWIGQFSGPADVREWSAVPVAIASIGGADSTTQIQAALNTGLSLFFPAGQFNASTLTFSGNGQQIRCAGPRKTALAQNSTTGNFIIMTGLWNGIDSCFFEPTVRTTGNQVVMTATCYRCFVTNFEMAFAFDGISSHGEGQTIGSSSSLSTIGSSLGHFGILFQGTNSAFQASVLDITNILMNNAYPVNGGSGTEVVTWATSTPYVAGDITLVNGAIYQEQTSTCTSASSGSGPSGMPAGTSPFNVFNTTIADGTCHWFFVNNSFIGFANNSWGNSAEVVNLEVLNGFECVLVEDTNNPGALSEPHYLYLDRPQCDHNFQAGINLGGGYDVEIMNPYASSVFQGNGILIDSTYTAIATIIGGRIADNWQSGILIAGGSNITVQGANIGSNSQSANAAFNNITVAAGISQLILTNNFVGKDSEASNAPAFNGININAGASDYYIITGNVCGGGVNNLCVGDGGTGAHKTVSGNQ